MCWLCRLARLLQLGPLLEALAQWLVLPGPTSDTGAWPVRVAAQFHLQLQGQAAPLEHAVQLVLVRLLVTSLALEPAQTYAGWGFQPELQQRGLLLPLLPASSWEMPCQGQVTVLAAEH